MTRLNEDELKTMSLQHVFPKLVVCICVELAKIFFNATEAERRHDLVFISTSSANCIITYSWIFSMERLP